MIRMCNPAAQQIKAGLVAQKGGARNQHWQACFVALSGSWSEAMCVARLNAGCRWLRYYLAHNSQGPTKGDWWEHVAPAAAFQQLHIDPLPYATAPTAHASWQLPEAHKHARLHSHAGSANRHSSRHRAGSSSSGEDGGRNAQCPLVLLGQYMQAVQQGLPVDRQPDLECSCRHVLGGIVTVPLRSGRLSPQTDALDAGTSGPVLDVRHWNASVRDSTGRLVPDGSPLPALRCSAELAALSGTLQVIQHSIAALQWLQSEAGRAVFPSLFDGSMA